YRGRLNRLLSSEPPTTNTIRPRKKAGMNSRMRLACTSEANAGKAAMSIIQPPRVRIHSRLRGSFRAGAEAERDPPECVGPTGLSKDGSCRRPVGGTEGRGRPRRYRSVSV